MISKAKPINKPGRRNFGCLQYGDCLDYAVECQWQYWSCSDCPHRFRKTPVDAVRSVRDARIRYEMPSGVSREVWHRFN